MNIKLNHISISHFKGISSFGMELYGYDAVITAENGVGKTTVYDAFLWLLFGKDSTGRKEFELRPLDHLNHPLKGVVVKVEADITIDGNVHCFRREQQEKVVKDQLKGYVTFCWIDEVPKKLGEYNEYIAELLSEDTFKLLTDLTFFNEKMNWPDRRKVLLDIAGDIGTPEGFESLLAELNGREIKDYEKVLQGRKKLHVRERDEINPRIDEILHGLEQPAYINVVDLTKQRTSLTNQIENLRVNRQELIGKETERQQKLDQINQLKSQKIEREAVLKNDMSGIQDLLQEKTDIEVSVNKHRECEEARNAVNAKLERLAYKKNELNKRTASLAMTQQEYTTASEQPSKEICYACGQKLPADKLKENEDKRQKTLAEITDRGNGIKKQVDALKVEISGIETDLKELETALAEKKQELQQAEEFKTKRFAKIDETIKNRATKEPKDDTVWNEICNDIIKAEAELGQPVSEQLEAIEQQRILKQNEINTLNETLAQADRLDKDRKRVSELEAKEKDLAQEIAEIDRQLHDIERYNAEYSSLIEAAVNDKFKYVTFKMFKEFLNEGLKDTCEAMLNGVPYPDMSAGQQILCGIDIINVLSEHYGLSVPLFIDHAESVTYPLEANSQTIELCAKEGIKELHVKVRTGQEAKVT